MNVPEEANQSSSALSRHGEAIDHVAIAVRDLESSIAWFTSVLGFTLKERRKTEGANTGMISAVLTAGPLDFVLLQGTSPQSQVSRFIEHYGPGVQHIAIRVDNLDSVSQDLSQSGLSFDTPIIEGGGLRQLFTKRDQGSGLMIEFIQRSDKGFADQNVSALFAQLERNDSY